MSKDVGLEGINNLAGGIKSYQFAKLPKNKRINVSKLKFTSPEPRKTNKPEPLEGEVIEPTAINPAPKSEEIWDAEIIEPKKPVSGNKTRSIEPPAPKAIAAPTKPVSSGPKKVSSQRVNPMSLSDTSHMPAVNLDLPRQFNGKA